MIVSPSTRLSPPSEPVQILPRRSAHTNFKEFAGVPYWILKVLMVPSLSSRHKPRGVAIRRLPSRSSHRPVTALAAKLFFSAKLLNLPSRYRVSPPSLPIHSIPSRPSSRQIGREHV